MERKDLIIIGAVVIIAIICLVTAFFFVFNNNSMEYTNLQVSESCSLQVPVSDSVNNATDNYGIFYYVDKEHNLNITSFNSQDGVTLSGAVQMASLRDSQQLSSQVVVENGTSLYYNKNTGIYTIFIGNDTTHDNLLISTTNKDLLLTVLNSVNYLANTQDDSNSNRGTVHSVSSSPASDTNNSNSTPTVVNNYYYDYANEEPSSSGGSGGSDSGGSGDASPIVNSTMFNVPMLL